MTMQKGKREKMDQLWKIYEEIDDVIYVEDMETYELIYMNRKARELYGITSGAQYKGKKCYEFLQNSSKPCAICTNDMLRESDVYKWEHYNPYLKKMFKLRDQKAVIDGRSYRIEIAIEEKTEMENSEHRYHRFDDMAILMNECMRMSLEKENLDQGIQELMEYLGQVLMGERVYIFELSENNEWNNTYEWCACGITEEKDFLQNIPYNTLDVWINSFIQNHFMLIRDVEKIKESDPACYAYLEPQNINSIIVGPLWRDGKLCGFYGIDNPPAEKMDEVAALLKTIAHVIEAMLSKRDLVKQLEELSYLDQMSQMGNRHAVNKYFQEVNTEKSIGVVYCDVCGLKRVNDTEGHAAGDKLLLQASACLQSAFEGYDRFRIGGDEMLVLASGISRKEFKRRCRELRMIMMRKAVPLAVGEIWKPRINDEMDRIIEEADAKMYEDKKIFYESVGFSKWRKGEAWIGASSQFEEIVELMDYGFDRAIEEGQFEVWFQPQYDQKNASLHGAEALVRWKHPEKGMISPAKFIPFLEQNGMLDILDDYVLRQTCRYQKKWIEAGKNPVPISVNLSRKELLSEEVCYRVQNTLSEMELPVSYINLEITESAYIENAETVIEVVQKFQSLGFKVEMDDFGSGYSSLNSFKDIPVDILKLDMKFVSGEHIDERSGKILSSIVSMAHWLDIPVIAEGIETKEQAEFLSSIGCDYMQGYYYDRPLPVEEYEKRLSQKEK